MNKESLPGALHGGSSYFSAIRVEHIVGGGGGEAVGGDVASDGQLFALAGAGGEATVDTDLSKRLADRIMDLRVKVGRGA